MEPNPDPKKHRSTIDKIIMGAIIGTAIGSAIGASVAPKKGSETRERLKELGQEAGSLTKETGIGILRLIRRILLGKKKPDSNE